MPVESANFAPYAPTTNVVTCLEQLRDRGWPNPLTYEDLGKMGIPEGNITRTYAALKFLRLLNDTGQLTDSGEQIRKATSEEYPSLFGQQIKEAYSEVFTFADPATATSSQLENAFRGYQPQAQRPRMIVLFKGLCVVAGFVAESKTPRVVNARPAQGARTGTKNGTSKKPSREAGNTGASPSSGAHKNTSSSEHDGQHDHNWIKPFLQKLPTNGEWTKAEKKRWTKAIDSALDLWITVSDAGDTADEETE